MFNKTTVAKKVQEMKSAAGGESVDMCYAVNIQVCM